MPKKLKDIAKQLGVSSSTVSKVLNNRPGVSEEQRKKILQAIEEMNFRPRQRVGGLVKDETVNVNLLVRINQSASADPFYSLITEGISQELQNYKCNLLYYVLNKNIISQAMFKEIFEDKNVDGNILVGADYDLELIEQIYRTGIPTILVDNYHPNFNSVNTDNYNGAYAAVKHLVDLNHTNIIFLSGPLNHASIMQRCQGYQACLNQYAKLSNGRIIECGGVSVDDGYRAINAYEKIDFTAIFAANDKLAIGAIKALKEKGFRIPEDISIVGFDDIEWGLHTDPPLTTVRVAKQQIGMLAAQLFINLSNKKVIHPVDIRVSTKLIERNSTARAKKS